MTEPMLGVDDRAVDILKQFIAGDVGVRDQFDATMQERLSPEVLAASMKQVVALAGEFVEFGEPLARVVDAFTVVDVPARFSGREMKGRVAFDGRGLVAGLFILERDVP